MDDIEELRADLFQIHGRVAVLEDRAKVNAQEIEKSEVRLHREIETVETRLKDDMGRAESRTLVLIGKLGDEMVQLNKTISSHMEREESFRWKAAAFLIVSLGTGCIGMGIYIFQYVTGG